MSAAVWERRRRGVRFWREVRRGLPIVANDPCAVVPLPEGLVLISYAYYVTLTNRVGRPE